jgi:hypothetical protein
VELGEKATRLKYTKAITEEHDRDYNEYTCFNDDYYKISAAVVLVSNRLAD